MRPTLLTVWLSIILVLLMVVPSGACPDVGSGLPACGEPALDPPPVGVDVPCEGIRPGADIRVTKVEGTVVGCTAGFLFRGWRPDADGELQDAGMFLSTVGHCFSFTDINTTFATGEGPEVRLEHDGTHVGHAIYAVAVDTDVEEDFALVAIDPAAEHLVDPAMCFFGGPTRLDTEVDEGQIVRQFGHGIGVGWFVQARSGVSRGYMDGGALLAYTGVVSGGDSGGPVMSADGGAAGLVSELLPLYLDGGAGGTVQASALGPSIARAEARTGLVLELLTASLVD